MTAMTVHRREITRPLLATPGAVKVARDLAEAALRAWRLDRMAEDVTLVVSELVTNAARAKPYAEIRLTVFCLQTHIGVEVWDELPEPPTRRRPADVDDGTDEDFGGRGLTIVEALTEHWDVRAENGGKTVWALLRVIDGGYDETRQGFPPRRDTRCGNPWHVSGIAAQRADSGCVRPPRSSRHGQVMRLPA